MRLDGGKGQMGDLIQDDSESMGDGGDYFDPNAGQENNFGANNIKAWDGRGGKMPTFARNTPQPHMPRQYGRGSNRYRNDAYFRNPRNRDKPLLQLGLNEKRVIVNNDDLGMIIGRRWTTHAKLEDEFGVKITIPKGEPGDRTVPIIIGPKGGHDQEESEKIDNCRRRIKDILSGQYVEPDSSEEEPDDASAPALGVTKVRGDNDEKGDGGDGDGVYEEQIQIMDVKRKVYEIHEDVRNLDDEFISDWRKDNNQVSVDLLKGEFQENDETRPCLNFHHAFEKTSPKILEKLLKMGFEKPSPIQSQMWPIALSGHDVIGISQTGSGKTLSFLAPLVAHILKGGIIDPETKQPKPPHHRDQSSPVGLVVAPARELANQIADQCRKVFEEGDGLVLDVEDQQDGNTYFRCLEVTGGAVRGKSARGDQIMRIEEMNPILIIGTPGRLNDLFEDRKLHRDDISFLVLDEADRLLEDASFEFEIKKLLGLPGSNTNNTTPMTKQRQTILTSATWGDHITELAFKYMRNPYKVQVGELDLTPAKSVTQEVIFISESAQKFGNLCKFIDELTKKKRVVYTDSDDSSESDESETEKEAENENFKAIIFCSRKDQVDRLYHLLVSEYPRLRLQAMHGDHEQTDREHAIYRFRNSKKCFLVATDVASRGIDVDDVTHVYNYDMPTSKESFVHRVGRTGRAGRTGKAVTLFGKREDQRKAIWLRDLLKSLNPEWTANPSHAPKEYGTLMRLARKEENDLKYTKAKNSKKVRF